MMVTPNQTMHVDVPKIHVSGLRFECQGGFAKHSACFGSCSKSSDVLSPDQRTKIPTLQGRGRSRPEKDFWTSTSNQSADTCETTLSPRSIDANYGVTLWNEQRRDWTEKPPQARPSQPREPVLSWTSTYEDLLSSSRAFPKPIPLREMVHFLVGVWEQEGLYD